MRITRTELQLAKEAERQAYPGFHICAITIRGLEEDDLNNFEGITGHITYAEQPGVHVVQLNHADLLSA